MYRSMSETGRVTSELLGRATSITVPIDVVLLLLVARFVSAGLFAKLKWHVVAAACVVYALLWCVFGSMLFWDAVYSGVSWLVEVAASCWIRAAIRGVGSRFLACEHPCPKMASSLVLPAWGASIIGRPRDRDQSRPAASAAAF